MLASLKRAVAAVFTSAVLGALVVPASAQAPSGAPTGAPITIGFGMALTGPLAANGKMSLVAMKIWEEDVNAKGGLLGRPVKLIYYDDQSSPTTVPGIYTKLLDVDKVDFAVSPYASTQIVRHDGRPFLSQAFELFQRRNILKDGHGAGSVALWIEHRRRAGEHRHHPTLRMTQQDLADSIGVTRQTVNAIELGKYSPSLEVAFQIAAVFNMPLDQVFQYEKAKRVKP